LEGVRAELRCSIENGGMGREANDSGAKRTRSANSGFGTLGAISMSQEKISCRKVWKLYGRNPASFLEAHQGAPGLSQIREAGYIPAVRDVSLEVMPGEILVIMGLSGSGKSTLVRCLSRLIEPTAGEIFFDGQDLLKASDREMIDLRRHKMGMVFQHFALLPHRTVLQNVAFPLEVQGIARGERETRAREIIDLVGLKGRESYYPRELSGGQQQRVGIARSLAVEPDVWFLDEPFSALDPLIRREMQDEFLRLQQVLKKTIVFITHDFNEAIRLADRIAIMKEGSVDQCGTAAELIANPATDYVREFTKDVPREKLLTLRSIMGPLDGSRGGAQTMPSDMRIEAAAKTVLESEDAFGVTDAGGAVIGVVDRNRMIEALFGGRT
jgi:glycine betaine/proline transport system ATP-binding protein